MEFLACAYGDGRVMMHRAALGKQEWLKVQDEALEEALEETGL